MIFWCVVKQYFKSVSNTAKNINGNFISALWPYFEVSMARPTLKYFDNKPIKKKKSHKSHKED